LTSLCASLFCALELARLLLLYLLVFGDLLPVLSGRFAKVGSILAAPAPHCSWRSRAFVAFMPSNMQERRHFHDQPVLVNPGCTNAAALFEFVASFCQVTPDEDRRTLHEHEIFGENTVPANLKKTI
jgi:hypothetical protein